MYNHPMGRFWKNAAYKEYYVGAFILSFLSALLLLLIRSVLPPIVPLFYGRPAGEAQLGSSLELLIIPGISILITFINFFISLKVRDNFLKKVLVTGTLAVSILTTLTLAKIVFLVGFF